MASQTELLNRKLPKYSQMLVTGSPLTTPQALSIIRRTDLFFQGCSGNDRAFNAQARKIVRMPENPIHHLGQFRDSDGKLDEVRLHDANATYWVERRKWEKAWGVIPTQYIFNDWISSGFGSGPHGWCHPNGIIGFTKSIGKHPVLPDVFGEWRDIAREFPFVEAEVTLMDAEEGEHGNPVISFLIRDGRVEAVAPEERDIHEENARVKPRDCEYDRPIYGNLADEHVLQFGQLEEWAGEFLREHPEYCSDGEFTRNHKERKKTTE